MPTLTLIDGSGFIFRAYHAIPHLSSSKGVPTNAVYGFTTMLLKALREHAPTHVALVFDAGRRSFRNDLYPDYKANRPPPPDDLVPQFPLVREVARALNVPVLEEAGFEADDLIATLADRARAPGASTWWSSPATRTSRSWWTIGSRSTTRWRRRAGAAGGCGRPRCSPRWASRRSGSWSTRRSSATRSTTCPGIPGVGEKTAAALIQHFGTVEAMLARPDEIPAAVTRGGEKLKEKIVASAERLRLNRRLVELRRDLDLPVRAGRLRAAARSTPERARALFKELEFGRLLRDLRGRRGGGRRPAAPDAVGGAVARSAALAARRPCRRRRRRPAPARGTRRWSCCSTRAALGEAVAAARAAGPPGSSRSWGTGAPLRAPVVGLAFAGAGRAFYLPLGAPLPRGARRSSGGRRPRPGSRGLASAGAPRHAHGRKGAIHALGAARAGATRRRARTPTSRAASCVPTRREHLLEDVARERAGIDLPPQPVAGRGGPGLEGLPGRGGRAVGRGGGRGAAARSRAAMVAELEARGLTRLYREVELPLVPILAEMERTGIAVDRGAMEGMSAEFGARDARAGGADPLGGRPPVQRRLDAGAGAGPLRGAGAPGPAEAEDGPVDGPGGAREAGRAAPAARARAGAPLAVEAQGDLRRRAAAADRSRRTAGSTRPSTRRGPRPGGSPRRIRTSRTSRSGRSCRAGSAPPSSRRRGCGSCRPTTRRSSCGSSRTTRRTRRCSSPSGAARTSTPGPPPRPSRSRRTR